MIKIWKSFLDPVAALHDPNFPIIATTFRVTEHWDTGSMTRNLTWLAELMPEIAIAGQQRLAVL